jgi:hypothetical protein
LIFSKKYGIIFIESEKKILSINLEERRVYPNMRNQKGMAERFIEAM